MRPASSKSTRSAIFRDLTQRVRREKQRRPVLAHQIVFQQPPEIRGCQRVEAARGFIEQQNSGLMKQRARQTHAMGHAGGKSAHLAIEFRR